MPPADLGPRSEPEGAPVVPRGATPALRAILRPVKLVVTALAIVIALALGIPWLIGLVW